MDRYLVESPHTPEECKHTLKEVLTIGSITHFDWGCMAGEHCGWVILEAETEAQARMVVPAFLRNKARVIKLNKFSPEQVKSIHGM